MSFRIPLAYNTLGEAEIAAATQVLSSGSFTQGPRVRQFEEALARRHGVRHAIFVNSGSSANLIAIEAAVYLSRLRPDLTQTSLDEGDEVIIQGLNWPSTLTPILNRGLRPVLCDVDMDSLNASVAHVEAVRTNRTKMVVAVPVLGNPTHLDELRDYCRETGLILMEDACESIGAITPAGRPVGTLGLASAYSFYFSHHITTIEGGAILTDDPHLADLCYALRAHGWSRGLSLDSFLTFDASQIDSRFCFVVPGYNVRSTDLNAAIGLVQLDRLDAMLARRREIAAGRAEAVRGLEDKIVIPGAACKGTHSWMTTPILFASPEQRDRARDRLEETGVETRPIIVGNMLRHPLAKMLNLSPDQQSLPNCDRIFRQGLMIGLSPVASDDDEALVHTALRAAAHA